MRNHPVRKTVAADTTGADTTAADMTGADMTGTDELARQERSIRRIRLACIAVALAALVPAAPLATPIAAQQPTGQPPPGEETASDSTYLYDLDAVVVTAERSATPLAASMAATSVLQGDELRRLPVRNLADALQQTPGFTFLDFDGSGRDPQPVVRGFYGGGEAEYLVVLLDGQPFGELSSGLVNWDLVPLAAVQRIEIVRGGASSLYGDAAMGGVVNVITRSGEARQSSWRLAADELGSLEGGGAFSTEVDGRVLSLFGDVQRTDGYRDHAQRWNATAGGSLGLVAGPRRSVAVSVLAHRRVYEEPGPLATAALDESRVQSTPFYRFDETDERLYRLALKGDAELAGSARLSGYLAAEHQAQDGVRTLALSPEFADSKDRRASADRLLGSVQVELSGSSLPWQPRLLAGTDLSVGSAETGYYEYLSGDEGAYRGTAPEAGEAVARGDVSRSAAAAFVRAEARPASALTLTLGGRLDWLRDTFEPRGPSAGERKTTRHVAFSPKAGINLRYIEKGLHVGHLYANIGRSFKAPTLEQLFDPRPIPVPFPPFAISTSSAQLDPQYGTSVELGLYHRAELLPDRLGLELTMAGYQMDMEDEIDFDIQQFKYVNIGKSRHRGLEAGLKLHGPGSTTVFANYTLQDVVSRQGAFAGKNLKAIPRHVLSGGVSAAHGSGLAGSLLATSAQGIWLDDANTLELPGYTRVDARLSYPILSAGRMGPLRLSLNVINLFDRAYSTTGFPDPAGTGVVYYYPAAGRVFEVGLRAGT